VLRLADDGRVLMADVLLFHHAQGLTAGVHAFADDLRAAGHRVTVPDLYDGRVFASIDDGVAHAEEVGFDTIIERGLTTAQDLPSDLVYAGLSLGAMPAQRLAQQRPGARAAVLYHAAVPLGEFGDEWPDDVALQLHVMVDDPFDDLPVMEDLVARVGGQLFTYPGDAHLFTDRSLDDHDPEAARLAIDRTLDLLASIDRRELPPDASRAPRS
jgi:dienelactone hydrolase